MNQINSICFVTNGYPSAREPLNYNFLEQFVCQIADLGVNCRVVHPVSLTRYFGKKIPPLYLKKKTFCGHEIEVYCPRYISFSAKKFGKINTAEWTLKAFTSATKKVIRLNHLEPDALYGHFIYPSGLAVTNLSEKFGILAFTAVGEGEPWSIAMLGKDRTCRLMKGKVNFFAVSTKAKKMLMDHGLGDQKEVMVFPNGVNLELFCPMRRSDARAKYGFPQDGFIVAFVGKFSTGKGISHLNEAIRGLDGVWAVYVGNGDCKTDPETTLFKEMLPHGEVPVMLNAADIFVLPTLVEGCSNAIIEALACGLPIVSSNYDFNDAILDDKCSIRVDPLNVGEIRQAILTLMQDHDLREQMSQAALQKASQLDLHKRAQTILDWMESKMPSPQAAAHQE